MHSRIHNTHDQCPQPPSCEGLIYITNLEVTLSLAATTIHSFNGVFQLQTGGSKSKQMSISH